MTNAVYLLPRVLAQFRQCHPELELLTRNTREAIGLLRSGTVEVALVEGPFAALPGEIRQRTVVEDELVLIVPPKHGLAAQPQVSTADLQGLELVQHEVGSGTRETVEQVLADEGVSPRVVLEATGIEAVKEAVLGGLGAGFISKLAVRREVEMGLLVAFSLGKAFLRPLTLLYPPLELCSQATRAFLALLAEVEAVSGRCNESQT